MGIVLLATIKGLVHWVLIVLILFLSLFGAVVPSS